MRPVRRAMCNHVSILVRVLGHGESSIFCDMLCIKLKKQVENGSSTGSCSFMRCSPDSGSGKLVWIFVVRNFWWGRGCLGPRAPVNQCLYLESYESPTDSKACVPPDKNMLPRRYSNISSLPSHSACELRGFPLICQEGT